MIGVMSVLATPSAWHSPEIVPIEEYYAKNKNDSNIYEEGYCITIVKTKGEYGIFEIEAPEKVHVGEEYKVTVDVTSNHILPTVYNNVGVYDSRREPRGTVHTMFVAPVCLGGKDKCELVLRAGTPGVEYLRIDEAIFVGIPLGMKAVEGLPTIEVIEQK